MSGRRWVTHAEPWLGLAVITAALVAFALALRAPRSEDLWARTRSKDTFLLLEDSPLRKVVLGPDELKPRIERVDVDGVSSTELLGWRVVYGKRWERMITVPSITGPLQPEGTPWPCSVKVRMRQSFLDDGKDHTGDVMSIIDAQIRDQFPRRIEVAGVNVLSFAKVRASKYSARLEAGKIGVHGEVTLDDSSDDPTVFRFDASIVLKEASGDLQVGLEGFDIDWKGKTRRALVVGLADIFVDVEKIAEGEVKREIGKVLPFLRLPKEAFDLAKLAIAGPDASVAGGIKLRLCSAPVVDASGIAFELGATVELTGPRRSMAIDGPPVTRGKVAPLAFPPPADPTDTAEGENLDAVASGEALQQTLYILWQSRVLESWGKQRSVTEAFRAQLQDRLTVEITELDVGLPPAFVSGLDACRGFGIRLADAGFGRTEEGWRAIAHADICALPSVTEDRIRLLGTLRYVAVDCDTGNDHTLRPCLSDVIPVLRAEDLSRYEIPLSMPIPERLIRVSLVRGAALTLSGLRAETRGGVLELHAKAKLVAER